MLKNCVDNFIEDLFKFLTGKPKIGRSLLVKKHSENIERHGDFSFPNTLQSWHEHLELYSVSDKEHINLLNYIGKELGDLISASKSWDFEVAKTKEEKSRIHLFLDRRGCIPIGLLEAATNNVKLAQCITNNCDRVFYDPSVEEYSITFLRLKYFGKSIENLYSIYLSSNKNDEAPKITVTSKSSFSTEDGCVVLCGTVLNAKTGVKEDDITANDYIRLRQNEMTLIAQHKYGVRVSTDSKWREFIDHLGESAVVFELLQTKPSSAVKINFDCPSAGSSKGASFILYNCARLEAIIKTFNQKVEEGTYPVLPEFKDVDFSLLTHEDEWCLVFNFIMGFPSVLNGSVEVSNRNCEFRPHQICTFLCSMVRVFSQYYRKVRILTEPRKHLLPVLFARLHLLIILNNTLKLCLRILNIKSVSQMYLCLFIYPSSIYYHTLAYISLNTFIL